MNKLAKKLVKLGKHRKDLRPHIRPVLAELQSKESSKNTLSDKIFSWLDEVNIEIKRAPGKAQLNGFEQTTGGGGFSRTYRWSDSFGDTVTGYFVLEEVSTKSFKVKIQVEWLGQNIKASETLKLRTRAVSSTELADKIMATFVSLYKNQ